MVLNGSRINSRQNIVYHIVSPTFLRDFSPEAKKIGLRRLMPDALTICGREATERNITATEGAHPCPKCIEIGRKLEIAPKKRTIPSKNSKRTPEKSDLNASILQENGNGAFMYLDFSNIFIGAKKASIKFEHHDVYNQVRINFHNMIDLIDNAFNVQYIRVVGTHVNPIAKFLENLEKEKGKEFKVIESPIINRREISADEHLQIEMLHDVIDYKPNTAIILTGDGNGTDNAIGFFEEIMRMHGIGWNIVLMAWEDNCRSDMREWVERNGQFVELDKHYKHLTFIQKQNLEN